VETATSLLLSPSQYIEAISNKQGELENYVSDGYKTALTEERRRFCFLVEKQCAVAKSAITYHAKVSRPHQSCRSATGLGVPAAHSLGGCSCPEQSPTEQAGAAAAAWGTEPGGTYGWVTGGRGARLSWVLLCLSKQLLAVRGRRDRLWFAHVPAAVPMAEPAACPAVRLTQAVPAPLRCGVTCAGELVVSGWGAVPLCTS